jgi:hypothetical protein
MINAPYPNIIAAIADYLQHAMGGDFQVSSTNQGVWAYYARETVDGVPYAVVQHGLETYTDSQAGGDSFADGAGAGELVEAQGTVLVIIIAPQSDLAESLARKCVWLCRDSVAGDFPLVDAEITYMRPSRAMSDPMTDIGPAIPGVFRRTVEILYKQQFYEPSNLPPVPTGG